MPHLTLEYTANIIEKRNFTDLFAQCHMYLGENLPTEIYSCKSRAIELKDFYIGEGEAANAFVHLNLQVLQGRTLEKLQEVGQAIMLILEKHFHESKQKLNLQISIKVNEFDHETYFKKT